LAGLLERICLDANKPPAALSHMRQALSCAARRFTTLRARIKMRSVASILRISLLLTLGLIAYGTSAVAAELNDYPTEARADYVFACMKTHGDTQLALRQCSCSIDVIATLLSYDQYVAAQTVLSLSQVQGRFGAMFRSPEPAREAVKNLRQAQAEAEVRCF
jgi:hypothetical protein